MNNQDFIIVGLNPWQSPLNSTSKYVAKTLAKQNRVLYVNPPLDRRTVMTAKNNPEVSKHLKVIKGEEPSLVQVSDNFWNYYPTKIIESINWIPNTRIFSKFNFRNNKRFANCIKEAIQKLGFKDYILINDKDIFRSFYLKELLNPLLYVYYDRDYLLSRPYWKKHGTQLEPQLAAKSDLILSHSDYLISLLKPYNSNIHNVRSGIDVDLFDPDKKYDIPEELAGITGPIVGYIGAVTSLRLDIEAFEFIAEKRPDWTIVMVGPEDETFARSKLHEMKNVIFSGRIDFNLVPAYINAMDVCLNLQIINEITIGNSPLKIDEYLALGKPVVSTKTIGMKPFDGIVRQGEQKEEYVSLIQEALNEGDLNREKYIKAAQVNSWDRVLDRIYDAMAKTLESKEAAKSFEKIV